jgi:putative FmdB family regulatory protein
MPHYDYICDSCGKKYEFFQGIKEGRKRKCPDCGEFKLRRLISKGIGVIFKGTGFYETDYKQKSKPPLPEKE